MFRRVNLINQVLWKQQILFKSTKAAAVKRAIPLITCRNTKFNLMHDETKVKPKNEKKEPEIELASKGWQHYKAKGDHFIIHPIRDVIESNLINSTNVEDLELNSQLAKNLTDKHNIHKVTKLQKEAIEQIAAKKNVLIAAETGCGKVFEVSLTFARF
jgi:HrpA-like RNA helicase